MYSHKIVVLFQTELQIATSPHPMQGPIAVVVKGEDFFDIYDDYKEVVSLVKDIDGVFMGDACVGEEGRN